MTEELARPATRPRRYKQAVVTWLGVYPALTVTLAASGPLMEGWPMPLRALVVSAVMVIALTWVILPFLNRVFQGWMLR